MPAPTRNSVFISYSHADLQWRDLLLKHLHLLIRDQKVEIWSDKDIRKGERWKTRIQRQLAKARVGIFLVSADFLASEFIHAIELPPLLVAAEKEGAVLLSVIVRPCPFRDSPLAHLQSMNDPNRPLSGLSKTEREQAMLNVYNELRDLFRPAPAKAARPTTRAKAAPKAPAPKKVALKPAAATNPAAQVKAIARRKAIAAKKKTATLAKPRPAAAAPAVPKKPAAAKPTTKKQAARPATRGKAK